MTAGVDIVFSDFGLQVRSRFGIKKNCFFEKIFL